MSKKKNRKKNIFRSFSLKGFFGFVGFKGLGITLILFLGLLYIFQVAEMTRDIHLVKEYNDEVRSALENNRKTEYGFLSSGSVAEAEERIEGSDFIRVGQIHYIDISSHQMALK